MSRNPKNLAMLLLTAVMAGCGAQTTLSPSVAYQSSAVTAQSIPPASAFVTVQAKVKTILPVDNQGLPHQNFTVIASNGTTYEVNNDTHYGSEVPDLKVGEALTIKGVVYKDKYKQGIHWTHHANKDNDAGWIQTPDGQIYQ